MLQKQQQKLKHFQSLPFPLQTKQSTDNKKIGIIEGKDRGEKPKSESNYKMITASQ